MWVGASSGMVSVQLDDSSYWVSRHIGGSFWHVVKLFRRSLDEPWNIDTQHLYFGGDHCTGSQKQTLLHRRSQVEYAYVADGEDVGALNHGNEQQTFQQWVVDGQPVEIGSGECVRGETIELTQLIDATGVNGLISKSMLTHRFDDAGVQVSHSHTWQRDMDIGYFYGAMMPVNNEIGETVFTTMYCGEESFQFSEFLNQSNVWTDPKEQYTASARGVACDCGVGVEMSVEITPETVDSYAEDNVRSSAWQLNRAGLNQWSKMYFERSATANPVSVSAGDVWSGQAQYAVNVYQPSIKKFTC